MKPDIILFPDASISRSVDGIFSSYATVILTPSTHKYTTISGNLSTESIAFAEGYAVYQGLRFLRHKFENKKLKVLVISDSKLTVETFNTFLTTKWNTDDWYDWKTASNTSVKNQELYRKMVTVINRGKYRVKFVHVNSHSDKKDGSVRTKIIRKMKHAGISTNDDTIDSIIRLNQVADTIATGITKNERSQSKKCSFVKLKRKKGDSHGSE